jgi:hypothetical protein
MELAYAGVHQLCAPMLDGGVVVPTVRSPHAERAMALGLVIGGA